MQYSLLDFVGRKTKVMVILAEILQTRIREEHRRFYFVDTPIDLGGEQVSEVQLVS